MNRRNFLAAALAAPWVVRSGVLMPVRKIVVPQAIIGAWHGITIIEDRVLVRTVHQAQKIGPGMFAIGPSVAAILKG